MSFHVGQRVVCIKEGLWDQQALGISLGLKWPVKGETYTIREIATDPKNGLYLRFAEMDNSHVATRQGNEAAFWCIRFRPLIERKTKTDISIFTKLLDPAPVGDPARVSKTAPVA